MSVWQLLFPKFVCPTCATRLEASDSYEPWLGYGMLFVWTSIAGVVSVVTSTLWGEIVGFLVALFTLGCILAFRTPRYCCDQCKRIVRHDDACMAPPRSQK
jgi:hypothetical protein